MSTKTNTSDRRDTILDAMLELVTTRGLHDAPMSALSRISGASAGIIYHYFAGKDDIIHALYERTSGLKRAALYAGIDKTMPPHDVFLRMWRNAYDFHRANPRETGFLQQYQSSQYRGKKQAEPDDEMTSWVMAHAQPASKGGLLKELPPEAIESLSFGAAAALARSPSEFDDETLKRVANAAWTAIVASESGAA